MNMNNGEKESIAMSATKMTMYLQCKWKYWCNYVLHLPRKPNVSFKLGLAVHEALALAGDIWKQSEGFTKEHIEKIKDRYKKVAAREGISDTTIYNDGFQMVMGKLKNNFSNGKILTVEDKFEVYTDQGVLLMGAMDKVEELREGTLFVSDYKTSKYFETPDQLKSDIQLSMYDAVAKIKYPDYERIVLCLDYLRGEQAITYRTDSERASFLEYLTAIHTELLKLKQEYANPVLNEMCNWCDFTEHCSAYQDAIDNKTFVKRDPESYSSNELVKEYMEIKNRKRILDNREKILRDFILNKIQSDEQEVVGQEKQIVIRQNSYTSYDPKIVYENIPLEDFLRMASISKKEVDEYLIKYPAGRERILETSKKYFTTPFLNVKNFKATTVNDYE
jgi:hypothetical protein